MNSRRLRAASGCALACLLILGAVPAGAVRPGAQDRPQARGAAVKVSPATAKARRELRARLGTQALMAVDPKTGTPRAMGRLDGFLTGRSERDGADIALDYVRGHADALGIDGDDLSGLRQVRRYASAGIEHIRWAQVFRGIPAIDSSLSANLTTTGRLIGVGGAPRHDLSVPSVEPAVSAADAYAAAASELGGRRAQPKSSSGGARRATIFEGGGSAKLVIYEGGSGPRLGWRLLVPVDSEHVYDVVADAITGVSQRQQNLVESATATRFENYPGAAAGGVAQSVNIDAFLNSGATTLIGPFARTFRDVNDTVWSPSDPQPAGSDTPPVSGNWDYATTPIGTCTPICTWDPSTADSWTTNMHADATQLHWSVSNFHEHLEDTPAIGFTNAAGNFEGDDPVRAQALDGANTAGGLPDGDHVNNANMATYPDGTSPHMQMYLTDVLGGQSTAYDAMVVYHEYAHGLIGRSVVDSQGFQAIGGPQGGAINEGTSDWYALDYLHAQGLEVDDLAARDVIGAKFSFGSLRSEPTDCLVAADPTEFDSECTGGQTPHYGGYTYADFGLVGGQPQVHADGEIFAQTMWQLRKALIAKHGATTGVAHARRLYTNGLRLAPDQPSFLDLRNAILQADTAAGFDDAAQIWDVFAERGMGYYASTLDANDTAPIANSSDVPAPGSSTGTVSGIVTNQATGAGASGVRVAFTGHDSGVGPELSAVTDGNGAYSISNVPTGTYPLLRARGGGYVTGTSENVTVGTGTTTRDFALRHNLASAQAGATVKSFTGADYSSYGCGPGGLIDDSQDVPWATTAPTNSSQPGAKQIVIELPAATTVGTFEIDPGAGCGDDDNSSLGDYELQVSPDNATFTSVAAGTFTATDNRRYNVVTPSSTPAGTKFVKLIAKSTQSTAGSGAAFMDVAEMRVFAQAGAAVAPTAVTGSESNVTSSGATLNGTINPNGTATSYQFEYGTNTSYGSVAPASPEGVGSGTTAQAVSQTIAGLSPSTEYHYRVVAVRGDVRTPGSDRSFTTPAAAPATPVATTTAATALTPSGATLNGTIDPNGTATSYQFEYGATASLGSVEPASPAVVGSQDEAQPVSRPISGLTSNTTYHYRVVAVRGGDRTNGAIMTFTTTSADRSSPPAATTDPVPAGSITSTGATLAGTVNPNGTATSYRFEYGETPSYGLQTVDVAAGSGDTSTPVTGAVSGLQPSTVYHYRVVATNANGTTAGAGRTFTTAAATAPPGTPPAPSGPGATEAPPGTTETPPGPSATTPPRSLEGKAKPVKKGVKPAKVACVNASATKVTCKITFPGAKKKPKVSATLKLKSATVARGAVKKANAKGLVTISGRKALPPGRYGLSVKVGRRIYKFKVTLG